ncbi:nucleolar and coiled-body phosphoprotein 1-like isoform X3 [Physella acuta]|uniref:nucleolar and coiled-body phosphoprotein 1-like isoform X3 n=1 Tax=Physella acuta TaxID=109671 RepID=UPI0027DDB5BC|nr:nucleolar and coiled-body phosphoprotein 1-like isoform X3 [Physella acuta]
MAAPTLRPPTSAPALTNPHPPPQTTPPTTRPTTTASRISAGAPVLQPATYARQDSRSNEGYSATSSYAPPGGPMSPRSESGSYGYPDVRGVSSGLENMGLESPRSYQPQVSSAPPPPPPPPPPSAPPPPPAPPLNDWNPTPYRRQNYQSSQDEPEEQKIPDQLLNTMLQSAKGGGPKPFSYGIDLSELKKKMGPPTAPKPRKGQPNYNSDDGQEVVRPGPPKKPAGQVQSDYFLSRNDDDTPGRVPRKPAGYVQGDYFLNRDEGPRSEVDESSIRVNMGTDPKKQSKSFKVLQWMTETEQDDPEGKQAAVAASKEVVPKTKRPKDPERRHNADDDEMRFTGLHTKADIPSKAFGLLKKISSEDNSPPTQNGKDTLDVGDTENGVGNYDETSIRYKGKNIPSPSFRVLQTWAEHEPDVSSAVKSSGPRHDEDEEDGLPESLNSEDMVDKRYKGGNIPSKVFKHLQKTVGDDTPEVPVASTGAPQNNTAPVSDF